MLDKTQHTNTESSNLKKNETGTLLWIKMIAYQQARLIKNMTNSEPIKFTGSLHCPSESLEGKTNIGIEAATSNPAMCKYRVI